MLSAETRCCCTCLWWYVRRVATYCATASQTLLVSLFEFQCWSASALRAELRRMNRFFFALWRGTFFFPSLSLSLSWRQTYVRGESLPTAPLCFCFSQWANVSLPRPHSLSSRPLSWKHSLAEATQGQACEVGGWGGGALPANHMIWPYSHSSTWGSDAASTFQQPVCHQHDWMRL